eukprot:gene4364-4945_t
MTGASSCGLAVKSKSSKRALFDSEEADGKSLAVSFVGHHLGGESPLPSGVHALLETPKRKSASSFSSPDVPSFEILTSTPILPSHIQEDNGSSSVLVTKTSMGRSTILTGNSDGKTRASVKVTWKSKTREKDLPDDPVSVESMLCRGTYKQIAFAVWRHSSLRAHMIEAVCKEINKECAEYCLPSKSVKPVDSKRVGKLLKKSPAKFKKAYQINEHPTACLRLTAKENILYI